jgi:uncharacterized protein YqeY
MSLVERLKDRLPIIMRDPALSLEKDMVRLVLGEVQLANSKSVKVGETIDEHGKEVPIMELAPPLEEKEVEKLIQKTINGNNEIIAALRKSVRDDDPRIPRMLAENEILQAMLPKSMTEDEVIAELEQFRPMLLAAKSDGHATGMAIGHFKKAGLEVQGPVVNAAVRKMRTS